ncbi:hypothetical protein Btru_027374 [Bulinus truncatus]|nr:hypothetical protein Btru_027374 [Bulinus truncatus]
MYNNNWNHQSRRNYSQFDQNSYSENYGDQGDYQDIYNENYDDYTAQDPENSSYQYNESDRINMPWRGRGFQYEREGYTAFGRRNDSYIHSESISQNKEVKSEYETSEAYSNIKKEYDKNEESGSDDEDDETAQAINKLPTHHSKGLMSTLIALNGPQALNRKPDPLPPPQPMKLETDEEKYLNASKPINKDIFLDYGITENMLEEANLEIEDIPCNVRDLLPTDIGKDADKPELFCKLCQVQTTSIGNFRDHLNGKSHKNALEKFRQGKKVSTKKKKGTIDPSDVGQKSVSMEMVEGLLEPILGLSYITEYHSISGIQCVCNLCGVKFDRNIVVSHLTGTKHRLHYMKEKKPQVYLHLKKFGGKKSQLSAFLDELSMDAEKEDGRGVPTIKIFEPDSSEEAQDGNIIVDTTEAALETKRHEAMLARRKPGTISFQDWVNEEFNKLKTNDLKRSPSPSGPGFGNIDDDIPVRSGTQHHNSFYQRRGSDHPYEPPPRAPYDPYLDIPHHPYLDSQRPRPFYSFTEPFPNHVPLPPMPPMPFRRDPYLDPIVYPRFPHPDPYLDPYTGVRRVETDLDPDPLKRIPPKTDAVPKDKIVIDYGHGSTSKTDQTESHPRSILKKGGSSNSIQPTDKTKPVGPDQWENDIMQILGQNTNVKAPDSLAMLSSTYSSPEKSPSPNRGSEMKKGKELPFSKSYIETNKLKGGRELPFSKSYLESNKLKDSYSHRGQETNDKRSSSRINPHSSVQRGSKSPDQFRHRPTHTEYKSRSPDNIKHGYGRNRSRDHEFGASRSRSPTDRRKHPGDRLRSPPESWNKRSRIVHRDNTYRSKEHFNHHRAGNSQYIDASERADKSFSMSSKQPLSSRSPSSSTKHSQYIDASERADKSFSMSSKQPQSSRSPSSSTKHSQSSRSPRWSIKQHHSSPSWSLKRQHSRSPESPAKYQRSKSPQEVIKQEYSNSSEYNKRHESNRHSRLIEDILSEPDAELQAERIANLLLQMSSTLTEEGDANTAIQKLLTNSDIKEALLATKTNPAHRNDPPPREKVAFSLTGYRGQTKSSTLPSDFGESDDESS